MDYIADIGLFLDICAVFLLAKFHVPSDILFPSGTEPLEMKLRPEKVSKNISKYKRYRLITVI